MMSKVALLLLGGQVALGDLYMMNPRCSNNRLNEKSANRANANRLFDSQNNNRGGYNVGDNGVQGFNGNQPDTGTDFFNEMYNPDVTDLDNNDALPNKQYEPVYMSGSMMRMTWTAQHGCGNAKLNCNMVIQFGCDSDDYLLKNNNFNSLDNLGLGTRMTLRDGGNTNTPNTANNVDNIDDTFTNNNNQQRGRHESEEWYYFATKRERNKGLFTADQNLKGNTQIYTRQNPNGNRRGLEVPEERDYYPYWGITPWRDIAWIGNDKKFCEDIIAPASQNVQGKGTCLRPGNNQNVGDPDTLPTEAQIKATTPAACTEAAGVWSEFQWNGAPGLDCQAAAWSQTNNHGNVDGTSRGGQMQNYMWQIPTIDQFKAMGCHVYNDVGTPANQQRKIGDAAPRFVRFVIRNRYNISTMDYDPYLTDAKYNQNLKLGQVSPIQQNPTVDVGAHMQGLRLAINTAQTGRTFQDRSHVNVAMEPASNNVPVAQRTQGNMLNVNVRGKRGNIVQTYPAVEYDFEPNDIEMEPGQCVHFQWTGSNTHNNGNPAGDGQAGDAGEGTGGTDRSNLAELQELRSSFPVPYDKTTGAFFDDENTECTWCIDGTKIKPSDAKIVAASGGYYKDEAAIADRDALNPLLNNGGASFRQGMCCCVKKEGVFNLVSTRNNNFTNRSQKLHIVVKTKTNKAPAAKWDFFPAKKQLTERQYASNAAKPI